MLKKADILVFVLIIVLCILSFFLLFGGSGKTVVVKKENEVVARLPLNKDTVYILEGNKVVIKDGKVYMESASCPDKLCVKHAAINSSSESIVCLPNRVIIEVK